MKLFPYLLQIFLLSGCLSLFGDCKIRLELDENLQNFVAKDSNALAPPSGLRIKRDVGEGPPDFKGSKGSKGAKGFKYEKGFVKKHLSDPRFGQSTKAGAKEQIREIRKGQGQNWPNKGNNIISVAEDQKGELRENLEKGHQELENKFAKGEINLGPSNNPQAKARGHENFYEKGSNKPYETPLGKAEVYRYEKDPRTPGSTKGNIKQYKGDSGPMSVSTTPYKRKNSDTVKDHYSPPPKRTKWTATGVEISDSDPDGLLGGSPGTTTTKRPSTSKATTPKKPGSSLTKAPKKPSKSVSKLNLDSSSSSSQKGGGKGGNTSSPGQKGGKKGGSSSSPGQNGGQTGSRSSSPGQKGGQNKSQSSTPGQKGEAKGSNSSSPGQPGGNSGSRSSSPGQKGGQHQSRPSSPVSKIRARHEKHRKSSSGSRKGARG